ncbi:MAG: hypothetical protein IJ191_02160 [Treponema sp.]|nr:hypothetical protein [Treponema sp.]
MDKAEKWGTIDKLAAGLDAEERRRILAQIKSVSTAVAIPEFQVEREERAGTGTLKKLLEKESFLYRFVLWIRSIFLHTNGEQLYNRDVLKRLARTINVRIPGLLDFQQRLLRSSFYEHLREMKSCADFFRPYLALVNDYPGEFYVFLVNFFSPDIMSQIQTEVDPYTISMTRDITAEMRLTKIRNLETIIKNIPRETRTMLYNMIRRIEWLNQFTTLPYIHFISRFAAVTADSYTCPFDAARTDYPAFARVFSSGVSLPLEALEMLFLFYKKKNTTDLSDAAAMEKGSRTFVTDAAVRLSLMQAFFTALPVNDVGRVVFNNYDWLPERFGGGEDWFEKFHEEWKRIFDRRWEAWLRDRKKVQLATLLQEHFGLSEFPPLPDRPWSRLWDGVQFNCELMGGFLVFFNDTVVPDALAVLKILLLDGIFINTENRNELSDILNNLDAVNERIEQFARSLAAQGTYGQMFDKLAAENVRTLQAQAQVDSMLLAAETQVHEINAAVCDICRTLDRIMHGIFGTKRIEGYDGVQNLRSIRGHQNAEFYKKLMRVRTQFANAYTLLAEIEPLDLPRYSTRSK